MSPRSKLLVPGIVAPFDWTVVGQVPTGATWLIKSLTALNRAASGTAAAVLRAGPAVGGLVLWHSPDLAASARFYETVHFVLPSGWRLELRTPTFGSAINVWVSGMEFGP